MADDVDAHLRRAQEGRPSGRSVEDGRRDTARATEEDDRGRPCWRQVTTKNNSYQCFSTRWQSGARGSSSGPCVVHIRRPKTAPRGSGAEEQRDDLDSTSTVSISIASDRTERLGGRRACPTTPGGTSDSASGTFTFNLLTLRRAAPRRAVRRIPRPRVVRDGWR